MTKKEITYAIESIEFNSRGLGNGSQVRAKNVRVNTESDLATANLELSYHGVKQIIKKQIYNVSGLQTWIFALSNNA